MAYKYAKTYYDKDSGEYLGSYGGPEEDNPYAGNIAIEATHGGNTKLVNGLVVNIIDPLQYRSDRAQAYGSIQDQLDMIYWDKINGTSYWKDHVTGVKASHPKPE